MFPDTARLVITYGSGIAVINSLVMSFEVAFTEGIEIKVVKKAKTIKTRRKDARKNFFFISSSSSS